MSQLPRGTGHQREARALRATVPALLLTFAGWVLPVVPSRALAAPPRLEIGDVPLVNASGAGGPLEVRVPVQMVGEGDADYVRVTLFYDPAFLGYRNVAVARPGWRVSSISGFRERAEGRLEGVFLRERSRPSSGSTGDSPLFELTFALEELSSKDSDRVYELSPILFSPEKPDGSAGGADSFIGYLHGDERTGRIVEEPTELVPGGVTYYRHSFVEVGGGEMTRREQTFRVPVYLTFLGKPDIVAIGVDYDELILREVRPITPPVVAGPVAIEDAGAGSSVFHLWLDAPMGAGAGLGVYLREHVADLVLRYEVPQDGLPAVERPGAVHIVPALLEADRQGKGGAAGARTVPGTITFVEPRFVRGNIDSTIRSGDVEPSERYLPDLNDVLGLLKELYVSGESLPCEEAGDVNDNGSLDVTDAILLLDYLFSGGVPPATPFPLPGTDVRSSPRHLGCDLPLPYFRSVEPR